MPKDYLDFMTEHNGGEGAVGDNTYMQLFSLEELEQINRDYSVKEFLPENCLIGSSMGGEFYGISNEGVYFAAHRKNKIDRLPNTVGKRSFTKLSFSTMWICQMLSSQYWQWKESVILAI